MKKNYVNIYDEINFDEIELKDLEAIKEALLNLYNIKIGNSQQQINDFLTDFSNRFYQHAVITCLIGASSTYSLIKRVVGSLAFVNSYKEACNVLKNLITILNSKQKIKNLEINDLNISVPYILKPHDYDIYRKELRIINEKEAKQKEKSL